MIELIKVLLWKSLSEHCYTVLVEKSNYDEQCLHQAAFTGLGIFIMILSAFLKIPQLLKIYKSQSGYGISMGAVYMELFALTAGASYAYSNGYPFSSWGEGLFLSLQQFAISALFMYYSGVASYKLLLFTLCYTTAVTTVCFKVIPLKFFFIIKACNLPLMLTGKLMQCWANYINKSTGQLSLATCLLTALVCLARLFTSVAVTRDTLLVLQFSVATFTNTAILIQVLWYWSSNKPKPE